MSTKFKSRINKVWPAALAMYMQIMSDPQLAFSAHEAVYAVATTLWETAFTAKPIREYGKGKGKKYGEEYYGRGYVQITWKDNYDRIGKKIGVDLVNNPDLALEPDIAYTILTQGMKWGWFTGKKLTPDIDWVYARKIVNGNDHAEDIAGIAQYVLDKLKEEGKVDIDG